MKWDNTPIGVDTLRENMKKFLIYCDEKNIKPLISKYDEFVKNNNLRGGWQTVEKRTPGFVHFREKIAGELGLDLDDYSRFWTDKSIYEAPQKCLEKEGDLKYLTYEHWRKENNYPSANNIKKRIGVDWRKLRLIYGDTPDQGPKIPDDEIGEGEKNFCKDCIHYDNCEYLHMKEKCEIWREYNAK